MPDEVWRRFNNRAGNRTRRKGDTYHTGDGDFLTRLLAELLSAIILFETWASGAVRRKYATHASTSKTVNTNAKKRGLLSKVCAVRVYFSWKDCGNGCLDNEFL